MTDLTIRYRHNTDPHRGLAVTGIFLLKILLATPHLIVTGILQQLASVLAYIGYWLVALTGRMPQAVHRILEITFDWTTRTWLWIAGIVDMYPPFETDPDYPATFPIEPPDDPSRAWAVAGIFVAPKFLLALPHMVALALLGFGAIVAIWFGYLVAAVIGRLPTWIQDFVAGVLQWNLRVLAWLAGITDEYPPFSLHARPSA